MYTDMTKSQYKDLVSQESTEPTFWCKPVHLAHQEKPNSGATACGTNCAHCGSLCANCGTCNLCVANCNNP